MTYESEPITDEELDAYLDELMEPEERKAFQERLRAHPEFQAEIKLDERVNAALSRLFPLERATEEPIKGLVAQSPESGQASAGGESPYRPFSRRRKIAIVALAASVAWIIALWQLRNGTSEAPHFEPMPVALVYQEVVDNGFEPYYECREEDRFVNTFMRRQGQALRLKELPQGSRMLGLSYVGGLSRDTTAMLCQVEGQPVIVFVDRLANDLPIAQLNDASDLNVFRTAKHGLVFYEVTPFDAARVTNYLIPN